MFVRISVWLSAGVLPCSQRGKLASPFEVVLESETDLSKFEDYLGEDDRWQSFHLLEGEDDPFTCF